MCENVNVERWKGAEMSLGIYGDGGSMKGSGIDSFEFDYGTFTCENDECGFENVDAVAYGDDWGAWSVACEKCETVYTTGERGSSADNDDDDWRDEE